MHIGSLDKMRKFVDHYLKDYQNRNLKILDVGSQDVNGSYKQFFNSPYWEYTGLDMVPGKNVDVVLKDVYNWTEVESDSYDVVVTGQVFEHVEYIWVTILEIARVLKEGGLCCIIAPSNGVEHRYPVDCWRYYPDGFRALAKYAGLNVIEVYTQWQNVGYTDGSDMWKDSVLICQKPSLSEVERQARKHKNFLAKLLVGVSDDSAELTQAYEYFLKSFQSSSSLKPIIAELEQGQNVEHNVDKLNDFPVEHVIQAINSQLTNKTDVFNQIAVTNFGKERYDNVIPYLHKALELKGNDSDTLYNLGYVLYKIGELDLAISYLERIEEQDDETTALIKEIREKKVKH